jgi:hypothetical protein
MKNYFAEVHEFGVGTRRAEAVQSYAWSWPELTFI